jgi:DNA-binding IclR family transcriptional regulator
LNCLVEANYLYRTSAKTYVLGPALCKVASVAMEYMSPLQIAQPEMRALADELDVVCEAVFREQDELVIRARAEAGPQFNTGFPTGTRMLLWPPFAAIQMAWNPPAEVERWMAKLEPPCSNEQRDVMTRAMTFAREEGFNFGVRNESFPKSWDSPELLFRRSRSDFAVTLQTELDRDQDYELAFVSAPIFDGEKRLAFILGLHGFADRVTGSRVEQISRKLCAACDRITGFIANSPFSTS